MSQSSPSGTSSRLLDTSFWRDNLNRILGLAVIICVIVAAVLFVRHSEASSRREAWAQVLSQENPTALREGIELSAIEGSAAEPWILLVKAEEAILGGSSGNPFSPAGVEVEDYQQGLSYLDRLEAEYADHPILSPPSDQRVRELREYAEAQIAWEKEHASKDSLTDEGIAQRVSLQTSRGPIVIGLYESAAPQATAGFIELLADGTLLASGFDEVRSGMQQLVLLSGPRPEDVDEEDLADDGDEDEMEEDEDEPMGARERLLRGMVMDRNSLSHLAGAVSLQRSANVEDEELVPQVTFVLADALNLDGQQVVFGKILEGMEILERFHEDAEVDEETGLVVEPLEVESYELKAPR